MKDPPVMLYNVESTMYHTEKQNLKKINFYKPFKKLHL